MAARRVAANAFISIRAISRSIPSRPNGARGNAWHSCIHRLSVLSRRIRGLPAPVLLAPACGALQPGTGAFRNLLSPEGFRRMSRLIAYMGPVSGEITLAKTYPWIAAEKAAFVAVLLGLYLLAARGIYRGEMHRACLWLLLGTSLYFFAVTAAAGERESLRVTGCRSCLSSASSRQRDSCAKRKSLNRGESSAFESKSPGRLAPWNAFDEFLPRRTPGKPGSLSLGRG